MKHAPPLDKRVADRFLALVDRENPTERGCWLWQGALKSEVPGKDYGKFWVRLSPDVERNVSAHRVAWAIANGEPLPPRSRSVCHTCDTPRCCCPSHLVLRDQLWNIKDRTAKARSYSKLTARAVGVIRRALQARTHSVTELAVRLRVSHAAVASAARGETWARLPGALDRSDTVGKVRDHERDVICALSAMGQPQTDLARRFGVSVTTVRTARERGSSLAHSEPPWCSTPEEAEEAAALVEIVRGEPPERASSLLQGRPLRDGGWTPRKVRLVREALGLDPETGA